MLTNRIHILCIRKMQPIWIMFGVSCPFNSLYLGTACSLLLMTLCIYQITVRVIEQRRFYKRKQILFLIILLADTFFFIFTMDRNLAFAYFLYFYFDQSFLIFLVYFFTKKATDLNVYNKSNTKLVRGCTYGLFAFFSILLLIDIIVYYLRQGYGNCSCIQKISQALDITLFVIRVVELFASIIFIIGAYFLNKKMNALITEQIIFTNRMTGVEKTQFIKIRNIKLKFWTLVCVTAIGQVIQWSADLSYFIYSQSKQTLNQTQQQCYFPAYNIVLTPQVDLLICLFGYFLPLFCAVYLFWFKKKQVQYVRNHQKWKVYQNDTIINYQTNQIVHSLLQNKIEKKKQYKLQTIILQYYLINKYLQLINYIYVHDERRYDFHQLYQITMSWDAYVTNLTANGVLEYAAIIGLDGNIWASNLGVAALPSYQADVPDEKNPDVTTKVAYDEKAAFVHALTHNGESGNKAGVRINNQKYYSVQFDGESKTWYLKKNKGGACVAWANTVAVFASFSQTINAENGAPQNASDCNKRVIDMAKYLADAGY
ncbi:unnamed protein product [Paramecium primaurelia]|uniref:Profilin n=1 Tax=Paramecium primaurelia TaxID=5886 RepID=A0A8S1NKB7_PARPR|nr:unnamed protein product [Paramecium primaurelia]